MLSARGVRAVVEIMFTQPELVAEFEKSLREEEGELLGHYLVDRAVDWCLAAERAGGHVELARTLQAVETALQRDGHDEYLDNLIHVSVAEPMLLTPLETLVMDDPRFPFLARAVDAMRNQLEERAQN